jgi:AbrB family looped-hinge helix DNA binding protein
MRAELWDCVVEREFQMETVTISPEFEVVIPVSIREQLKLAPGQKLQVIAYAGRIELVPIRPARELRGSLGGLDTTVERDREDRV